MSRKISTGKSLVLTNLATSQLLRTRPWHSLGINLRLIGPHKSASVQEFWTGLNAGTAGPFGVSQYLFL